MAKMESVAALVAELQAAVIDSAKEGKTVAESDLQELTEAQAAASTTKQSLGEATAALKKHIQEKKGHGGRGGQGGNICFSGKVGRVSGGIHLNYH